MENMKGSKMEDSFKTTHAFLLNIEKLRKTTLNIAVCIAFRTSHLQNMCHR
jgi:hypothetical protein